MDNNVSENNFRENVILGIVGALLFSLIGGVVYFLLNLIGYIAAISGFVAVYCAILGYKLFAKGLSKKGIIVSVIIAAVIITVSWYLCFCSDMLNYYEALSDYGKLNGEPPTFIEYLPHSFKDLAVNPMMFLELILSLVLGAVGCVSYVKGLFGSVKTIKKEDNNG